MVCYHEAMCHAEKLVYKLQCQGHTEGLYNSKSLSSRSRSQLRFKLSVNVCLDDIFWTTEHFVAKVGMVMQHPEPEFHAEFLLLLLSSRSRSQRGFISSKYDSFCYIFWIVDSLGSCRQKLKAHLVRTQSSNVLSLKPGIGQYIAIHATLTARDFFLAYFYPSGPFICIFPKSLPIFPVLAVANTWFLCRPAE